MTTTDWIIDIALVLIVLRQIPEERLTRRFVLLPAGIVAYVAHAYLHTIPTAGNDLALIAGCLAAGTALGVAGGLLTKVRVEAGVTYVRAGWAAASLWVASMTARLGFIVWITHAAGSQALTRFSVEHHITGATVWQSALVLLALSEVVARIGLIVARGHWLAAASGAASAADGALATRTHNQSWPVSSGPGSIMHASDCH